MAAAEASALVSAATDRAVAAESAAGAAKAEAAVTAAAMAATEAEESASGTELVEVRLQLSRALERCSGLGEQAAVSRGLVVALQKQAAQQAAQQAAEIARQAEEGA